MNLIVSSNLLVSSPCNKEIKKFLLIGLSCFREELELYIKMNRDPVVLGYSNERTLGSMYVNGLVRTNKEITALQEYKTYCPQYISRGRPDIFINYKKTAIWIESKFDSSGTQHENHWDIKGWLKWEDENILVQLRRYYEWEKGGTNNSYVNGHYLMTLHFKLVDAFPKKHLRAVQKFMTSKVNDDCERPWYYACFFIKETEQAGIAKGVEVYGTIQQMPTSAKEMLTS